MRPSMPVSLALLLFCGAPAAADIITLEPDAFAPGTDVSHASPGVTLWTITATSSLTDPLVFSPVYTRRNPACDTDPFNCDAVTGTQGFSPFGDGEGTLYGNWNGSTYVSRCFDDVYAGRYGGTFAACRDVAGQHALLMVFDAPTDFVEVAGAWNNDFPRLVARDAAFNGVPFTEGNTQLPRVARYHETILSITAATPSMRYVIAGSVGDATSLDALRYRSVPEPSSLALCAVGLVGLLRARKHYKARSGAQAQSNGVS